MFWKGLQESGSRHSSSLTKAMAVIDKYLAEFNKQLAKIFNVSVEEIPMPYASVTQHWYKWPIWTAWHNKAGGFDFPKVIETTRKSVDNKGILALVQFLRNCYYVVFSVSLFNYIRIKIFKAL
jgi:hypothetical protein